MDIALPPGYVSAVPFNKLQHKRLGVRRDAIEFARTLNVIYLSSAEFPSACHDYPIAFARDGVGGVAPLIISGLDSMTNLFIDEKGVWDADTYCPAYVRRYPFFTATVDDGTGGKAIICVDERGLDSESPSLFSATGKDTGRWREIELLVTEMDAELRKTAVFCERLVALELLEPFEAEFHPRGRQPVKVAGLLRVNEKRLRGLADDEVARLMRNGHLSRIYAHLLSFENFNRLLKRYIAPSR
jgi:hypothetical protein